MNNVDEEEKDAFLGKRDKNEIRIKAINVDEEEKDAFLGKRDKNEIRIKAINPCNRGMKLGVHRQSCLLIIFSLVVFTTIMLKKQLYPGIANNSTEDPFRIIPLSPQCLTYINSKDKRDRKFGTLYKGSCKNLPSPLKMESKSCHHSDGLKNHITSFPNETKSLQRFVMFLAPAHSGHSLVGSLLDAHPMMIVANEADIFSRYLGSPGAEHPYPPFARSQHPRAQYPTTKLNTKEEIFNDIFDNSLKCALFTRWQHGYNYTVPNGWGGTWIPGELRVIGDKKGGHTSNRIKELKSESEEKMIETFQEFQKTIDLPIHVIHVFLGNNNDAYLRNIETIKILNQGMPSHLFSASEWNNSIYTCGDDASRQSLLSDTCSNLGVPCDSHIIDVWSSMAKCHLKDEGL